MAFHFAPSPNEVDSEDKLNEELDQKHVRRVALSLGSLGLDPFFDFCIFQTSGG